MTAKRMTQAERRLRSEQKMLDAAAELVAARGSAGATLGDIGSRAGYSYGLVSKRFGSKAGLLHSLIRQIEEFSRSEFEPILSGGSGLRVVVLLVRRYFDLATGGKRESGLIRLLYVLLAEALGPARDLQPEMARLNRHFRKIIEQQIVAGMAAGQIDPDLDPARQATIIAGMIRGVAMQWVLDPDGFPLKPVVQDLVVAIERNLAVAVPSAKKARTAPSGHERKVTTKPAAPRSAASPRARATPAAPRTVSTRP